MANPAGESKHEALKLDFDRRVMLQFRGSVVTSDAGLLAYRELDDALGLSTMAGETLADARTGKNERHALVGLLRQSVFGRLAGYEDVNDAERLRHDPAMRWIVGGKAAQGRAASPSQMGRFETQWLTAEKNLLALADLSGQWIDIVHGRRPPKGIVLDMDSSVSPTHGEQENSVWNGHYACTCYHPLFVFNQFGDLERCTLRPGNVHSADGWESVFKPVIVRYQGKVLRIYFRADAAFAMPGVYECLEAERVKYAIRIPTNQVLQNRIGYLLKRPVGRPPSEVRRYYANFTYQAASWTKPRRVIAKVEWFGEFLVADAEASRKDFKVLVFDEAMEPQRIEKRSDGGPVPGGGDEKTNTIDATRLLSACRKRTSRGSTAKPRHKRPSSNRGRHPIRSVKVCSK